MVIVYAVMKNYRILTNGKDYIAQIRKRFFFRYYWYTVKVKDRKYHFKEIMKFNTYEEAYKIINKKYKLKDYIETED